MSLRVLNRLFTLATLTGTAAMALASNNFGQDVAFLKKHTSATLLGKEGGPQVVVVPEFQGRVMTSSISGGEGESNGWINYELIESKTPQPHIHAFGGEDRFWIGPEGGQYAFFFKPGDPFDFEHWKTPALIDTDKYDVARQDGDSVTFQRRAKLVNYSGNEFDLAIERTIRLLSDSDVKDRLHLDPPAGVSMVAYESENRITNAGPNAWTKDKGLLSIWILGMFKHSPDTTVVAPFVSGPESELGPIVNDAYFGKVPADRLIVDAGGGVLYFKGDGQYRSKIGLSPSRAKDLCGSYAPSARRLTIVQYTKPKDATDYVNSMWERQEQPYKGDVVNSYNDGPSQPGAKPLGPFYELETSSPALELKPGGSVSHTHRTFHFVGEPEALNELARKLLGVELSQITAAFGR